MWWNHSMITDIQATLMAMEAHPNRKWLVDNATRVWENVSAPTADITKEMGEFFDNVPAFKPFRLFSMKPFISPNPEINWIPVTVSFIFGSFNSFDAAPELRIQLYPTEWRVSAHYSAPPETVTTKLREYLYRATHPTANEPFEAVMKENSFDVYIRHAYEELSIGAIKDDAISLTPVMQLFQDCEQHHGSG